MPVGMPLVFQSTLPVRGGTIDGAETFNMYMISIHPPREGRDAAINGINAGVEDFNPPSP